ncbi:MAG: FAD-dependent thymidylate synthase [Nitrososphaerota archaeon]|nr:FAD-dependent thymidylate synthase [Aigarchaeota archaeon]MDW8076210.1 FAD-dependent thymidylate synthase [Nitrososphaerota archaeon]
MGSNLQKPEDLEVCLYSYGPKSEVSIGQRTLTLEPDVFIALEGTGTFEGISLEERLQNFLEKGKKLEKFASKMHSESTRRGHASLSTSVFVQFEVRGCSRIGSMLLVASRFGSYLQESQRRKRVDSSYLLCPEEINAKGLKDMYQDSVKACLEIYSQFCDEGIPIEDARYVLPLGIKTSLFVSTTLESMIPLIRLGVEAKSSRLVPNEVVILADKISDMLERVSPAIFRARMKFDGRPVAYPLPNPFKYEDLVTKIARENELPSEPKLLDFRIVGGESLLLHMNEREKVESLGQLSHLIYASLLEPMSLVAYHQAIRHRTVPTVVESIYAAVDRASKDVERWVVVPPTINRNSSLRKQFLEVVSMALRTYTELLTSGASPASAVYVVPQAIKIYTIRVYDGFNLLYPIGFVATRTCSYAQHEERGIAYKLWATVSRVNELIGSMMGEKCKLLGYCPEKDWCPIILKYREYNDELHQNFSNI